MRTRMRVVRDACEIACGPEQLPARSVVSGAAVLRQHRFPCRLEISRLKASLSDAAGQSASRGPDVGPSAHGMAGAAAYRSRFFQKHGLNPILGDLYRI